MEHCAQHRRREPQPRRQKTERCALLRGHGRNRTAERERDLNELPIYKRCRSPFPGEHATHRTFRGRVAVPTLTSGQQPEVDWTVTRRGVEPRSEEKHRKNSLPFVPCPRALSQRGAVNSIHELFNEKKSWRVGSRTPQHSREPQPLSPYCTASHDGCRKHYYQSSMR